MLDIHGHSQKQGVFIYGCVPDKRLLRPPSPFIRGVNCDTGPDLKAEAIGNEEVSTTQVPVENGDSELPRYASRRDVVAWRVRLLPRIFDATIPIFSFNSCSFKMQRAKASTMRMVAFTEMGVDCVYTVEASLAGKEPDHFGAHDLIHLGRELCVGILAAYPSMAPQSSKYIENLLTNQQNSNCQSYYGSLPLPNSPQNIIMKTFQSLLSDKRKAVLSMLDQNKKELVGFFDEMVAWRRLYNPAINVGKVLLSDLGLHELYGDIGPSAALEQNDDQPSQRNAESPPKESKDDTLNVDKRPSILASKKSNKSKKDDGTIESKVVAKSNDGTKSTKSKPRRKPKRDLSAKVEKKPAAEEIQAVAVPQRRQSTLTVRSGGSFDNDIEEKHIVNSYRSVASENIQRDLHQDNIPASNASPVLVKSFYEPTNTSDRQFTDDAEDNKTSSRQSSLQLKVDRMYGYGDISAASFTQSSKNEPKRLGQAWILADQQQEEDIANSRKFEKRPQNPHSRARRVGADTSKDDSDATQLIIQSKKLVTQPVAIVNHRPLTIGKPSRTSVRASTHAYLSTRNAPAYTDDYDAIEHDLEAQVAESLNENKIVRMVFDTVAAARAHLSRCDTLL